MEQELREWIETVKEQSQPIAELAGCPDEEMERLGYGHTLREILQQPVVWNETATRMLGLGGRLRSVWAGPDGASHDVLLTGCGSSYYVGECLAPALQSELRCPVRAVAAGDLLARKNEYARRLRTSLLVSFARSGDSPESAAVVERFLKEDPQCRHLFVTCNNRGRLATGYSSDPRTMAIVLHERTNDRSLVMTSSFTSMVLAGHSLGSLHDPDRYCTRVSRVADLARTVILRDAASLARVGREDFRYAVYLGSASRFGSAREASLKMMETTGGRVRSMAETFLGVRHGPMAAIHSDTLMVCFLSADTLARAYEVDLLSELKRKNLGCRCLVVGEAVPREILREDDVVIECNGTDEIGDGYLAVIDVLVGQWLAFFRCMSVGLQPDAPSPGGVIHRVVEAFRIHDSSEIP